MATATKAKPKTKEIVVAPLRCSVIEVPIRGISTLVLNQWSEKAKEQLRRKHAGEKKKDRSPRDPEAECEAATYRLSDGRVGVPAAAFRKAMVSATDVSQGLPKTHVRKGVFVLGDEGDLVAIETTGAKMGEHTVCPQGGGADLRYRPMFEEWGATLRIQYDQDVITADSIVNLVNRAGFGIGVCERRPEKDGNWGRFEVVAS